MGKYIDSEKLIAEIDEILVKAEKDEKKAFCKKDADGVLVSVTKMAICASVKKIITSLQQEQPEVDSLIRSELPDMEDDKSLGLCYCNQFGNHRMTSKDVREIARHFYKLGLNARKEEK